jgi:hypothetical protein
MSELDNHPDSTGDIAVTEHAVNGVPAGSAGGRHRGRWALGTGSGEREVPLDRPARMRVLAGSVIGLGFLFVAHWLAPEQGSLFAAPSGAVGWAGMICGIVGVWLVPGLWLSALMMRVGIGPAAWLGTRIATTLGWYVVVGPVIHHVGQAVRVTTGGILAVTTAATAAVCVGVALGLFRRPVDPWRRILVAAFVGGGGAQVAIWASTVTGTGDMPYADQLGLESLILVGCAALAVVGMLSRPTLPPSMNTRNMRTPFIALAVIAVTAAALLAVGAKWSPAQRWPSAYGAEQIPAPAGADVAFALSAIGPQGSELIRRANFIATDDTGRPVPVEMRVVPNEGTADRATLLVALPPSSQPDLCGEERMANAFETGAPVKLTVRDQASGLLLQAVIPIGWCGA